ncbi:MAG: transposase [Candidatus Omnitrophica bacterium]|nr:transposase [Candidatus Omnitrophota bacterium]MCF7887951.1 transposase [Candidatus Omnitrophota bacterium]
MAQRKVSLETEKIYHIFSKSIAGFTIFRNSSEYQRMKDLLKYYNLANLPWRFSRFLEIKDKQKAYKIYSTKKEKLVDIISYCIMPTHVHLVLKNINCESISTFMRKILDSYAKYFNVKTKRKGPLWQSRFENVLVETDEQLLHLTRYVHLNPATAYLVDKPEDWQFSSYNEFLSGVEDDKDKICNYLDFLDIKSREYQDFVNSQINYQKELADIKKLWIE